ncbi:MAG: WhiB family transcriptional regulator [Acidobacteria bacterium]|nr:WhiB family transcriptional regulator [Acidobacteriota bacterium]
MKARCRGADPNLFFAPNHAEKKEEREEREATAKGLCGECPARGACLDFALATREPHGVWGGLTEIERRAILAKRAG